MNNNNNTNQLNRSNQTNQLNQLNQLKQNIFYNIFVKLSFLYPKYNLIKSHPTNHLTKYIENYKNKSAFKIKKYPIVMPNIINIYKK